MPELISFVADNIGTLPHLKSQLDEQYKGSRPPLKAYDNLPTWLQDNEHVTDGYRPEARIIMII